MEEKDRNYIISKIKLPYLQYVFLYTSIKNKKILDAGCGWDWLYKVVKENGGEYFGIDPNEEKVETSKKLWSSSNFKKGYAENIPFKDSSFDIIISIDAVEHYKNLKKSFSEFYRVLKKRRFFVYIWTKFFQFE